MTPSALRMRPLGRTGLNVSELCFGTLTASPLQANLPPDEAGALVRAALDAGVNFIDTAQSYRNYAQVRAGIAGVARDRFVLASKTLARTADGMQKAVEEALRELSLEHVDIMHLHLVTSAEDFKARGAALAKLLDLKGRGLVKAIGISVHGIEPLCAALGHPGIDVCFPVFNQAGLGLKTGTAKELAAALQALHDEGKGIIIMKPLGGGHLNDRAEKALAFVRGFSFVDSVAIGMKDRAELAFNLAVFTGRPITEAMRNGVSLVKRKLLINPFCRRCGKCVGVCEQDALALGESRAVVDGERCILCGYCAPECPEFAIRLI